MTNLLDIEDSYPNGFHDAKLKRLCIDWDRSEVIISLGVDVSDINVTKEPVFRDVTVLVTGLEYIRVDGPDAHKTFSWGGGPLDIAGDPKLETVETGRGTAWVYRFFIHDWNSFISIAARNTAVEEPNR